MKYFFILLAVCSCAFGDISKKDKPATIKVALDKRSAVPFLDVRGKFFLYNPKTEAVIESAAHSRKGKVIVGHGGMRWNRPFPGVFEMRIVPADQESAILVNGLQYKGCLELYAVNDRVALINEVDIENYLKATLAQDLSVSLPSALLEMMAIVARTNLYYLAMKNPEASWHVEADKNHYIGVEGAERNLAAAHAVDKTRHQIMTFNGQPFPALWSPDCAGKSASYAAIFRKTAATPPGVDLLPSSLGRAKSSWSFTIEKSVLADLADLEQIAKIDLFTSGKSGKVYALRCSNETDAKDIDFFALQEKLGKDLLKSNDFTIASTQDHVIFKGYGEGAGVGLCLASADLLLKRRETQKKILKAFFPGVQFVTMRGLDGRMTLREENISPIWQ